MVPAFTRASLRAGLRAVDAQIAVIDGRLAAVRAEAAELPADHPLVQKITHLEARNAFMRLTNRLYLAALDL